jgi:hypothetical protein
MSESNLIKIRKALAYANLTGDMINILAQIESELDDESTALLRSYDSASDITKATGRELEGLARKLSGRIRRSPSRAGAYAIDKVFRFYTDTTFGDINKDGEGNPRDITLTNVNITTSALSPGFILIEDVVLDKDASEQWVGIYCTQSGKAGNVPAKTLTKHDFTDYTMYSNNKLKCMNMYPIGNGDDTESDDQLRTELIADMSLRIGDTPAVMRSFIMSVPDVSRIHIVPNGFGGGSLAVYVFATYGYPSASLLNRLEFLMSERVEKVVNVLPPERVWAACNVIAYIEPRASQTATSEAITSAISNYFDTINNYVVRKQDIESLSIPGVNRLKVTDLFITKETTGVSRRCDIYTATPQELICSDPSKSPAEVTIKWISPQMLE